MILFRPNFFSFHFIFSHYYSSHFTLINYFFIDIDNHPLPLSITIYRHCPLPLSPTICHWQPPATVCRYCPPCPPLFAVISHHHFLSLAAIARCCRLLLPITVSNYNLLEWVFNDLIKKNEIKKKKKKKKKKKNIYVKN